MRGYKVERYPGRAEAFPGTQPESQGRAGRGPRGECSWAVQLGHDVFKRIHLALKVCALSGLCLPDGVLPELCLYYVSMTSTSKK